MPLYHFSEDPSIRRFEPRRAPTSAIDDELVWAIDEWHAPMYYVPRQCPRACFWPEDFTSSVDRERWFGGVNARMVIAIESAWFARVRTTTLYRYTMPPETFRAAADDYSGHHVSRETVEPVEVMAMSDLPAAILAAGCELRVTPSLIELWKRVIASTLAFSGTRLRNAAGFGEVDWDAVPLGPAAQQR